MIRIEDTDQARSSEESARGILEDLAWLGILWDDGPELRYTIAGEERRIGGDARGVKPFFQAQRVAIYNAYIEQLLRTGRAYPAFESAEELDRLRHAATAKKETFKYPRPADVVRGRAATERIARARAGERHVIRFAMDDEGVVVRDQILGEVKIAPGEVDDFVIRKADGFPTYHFAVVVDDELMGVTHVLRAQEHLANTPRHVALQRAMTRLPEHATAGGPAGTVFRTPVYGHMPIICNMDGSKMSKRDKAKASRKAAKDALAKDPALTAATVATRAGVGAAEVAAFLAGDNDDLTIATELARIFGVVLPEIEVWDFRRNGYLPEAITNFIALLGWNPGLKTPDGKDVEKFDLAFLGQHFGLDRVGKNNSKFDRNKLLSFNGDAINSLSDEAFAQRWLSWCAEFEPGVVRALTGATTPPEPGSAAWQRAVWLARAIKPRAKTLRDGVKAAGFLMLDDAAYPFEQAAIDKALLANNAMGLGLVRQMYARLEGLRDDPGEFNPETIHALVEQLAQQTPTADGKPALGAVSQAIRVAVTGTTVSPGIGETLAVLGRGRTLARLERCVRLTTV